MKSFEDHESTFFDLGSFSQDVHLNAIAYDRITIAGRRRGGRTRARYYFFSITQQLRTDERERSFRTRSH